MLHPNRNQTALLYERSVRDCEAITRDFIRIEGMRSNAQFQISHAEQGRFYRLFDATEELMVTIEYCDRPCDPRLFEGSLASSYNRIITPDIRERVARGYGHILLEVTHGVTGGVEETPEIAAMLKAIGRPLSGATQAQFERRLSVLRLLTQIAIDRAMPLAVHWTQSGLLMAGDVFEHIADEHRWPGPLHIHPQLYGPPPVAGEPALLGLRTFGARHWLGREVMVKPHFLPWAVNFDAVLAFLRIANKPGGYVIPAGDSFGPEDGSFSYRVLHHDAGANIGYCEPETADLPLYELVPLKHLAHGYAAPDHMPGAAMLDAGAYAAGNRADNEDDGDIPLPNLTWPDPPRSTGRPGDTAEPRRVEPLAPTRIAPSPAALRGLPPLAARAGAARGFGRKGL